MVSKVAEWTKRKNRELRENTFCEHLNKIFQRCGKQPVEFAHIEPTRLSGPGRGRYQRYYDIIKNREKYKGLCHEHHVKYDRKQREKELEEKNKEAYETIKMREEREKRRGEING